MKDESVLEQISAHTQSAKSVWLTYLALSVITFFAVLQIKDEHFFSEEAINRLPFYDIELPMASFLIALAMAITALSSYLQFSVERLCYSLGKAAAQIGGAPLSIHVHPWLVSQMALFFRRWLRGLEWVGEDRNRKRVCCIEVSSVSGLAICVSALSLYAVGPALLLWLWYRSMPAHNAWLTLTIGLALGICVWVTWSGIIVMMDRLANGTEIENRKRAVLIRDFVLAPFIVSICVVSFMRTEYDFRGYTVERYPSGLSAIGQIANWFRPVPADLRDVKLTVRSTDWMRRRDAMDSYLVKWCAIKRRQSCTDDLFADKAFIAFWIDGRGRDLEALPKSDLRGRDLAFANLQGAFLIGIDMTGIKMPHANLKGAYLEGVILVNADLRHTRMQRAIVQSAVLHDVQMQDIVASGADFSNSEFTAVRLDGAVLIGVDMRQTVLAETSLNGADARFSRWDNWMLVERPVWMSVTIKEARFDGALFRHIDLSNVTVTSMVALSNVFGDRTVLRPAGFELPCHWRDADLTDHGFEGYWRGWIAIGPTILPAVDQLQKILPFEGEELAPNPDCAWVLTQ